MSTNLFFINIFDTIWAQGTALEEMINGLGELAVREESVTMDKWKQTTEHPLENGTIAVVHGQRGGILAVEGIVSSRFRYEILLGNIGQAKKWVTLLTQISPWLGPRDVALSKQLSSLLEYGLRTKSLQLSLAYETINSFPY